MAERNDRSGDVIDGLNEQETIDPQGNVHRPEAQNGAIRRPSDRETGSVREGAESPNGEKLQESYEDRPTRKL